MKEKKILVVQVRTDEQIATHDAGSYQRVFGDSVVYDIKNVSADSLHLDHIEEYDGYIVGGSHFMVYEQFPQKQELYDLVRYAVDEKKPLLGICFGFQVLTEVLGGTVLHDASKKEFGSYDMTLTEEGKQDPLFVTVPDVFTVQEAHESYASELPPRCVHLVSGEQIAMQGYRYADSLIYGVQFHPELSRENMHERMHMYNSGPITTYFFKEEVFESMRDSRESEKVLTNFVSIVKNA